MRRELATKVFLLIPLLTLSTGILGPDILLSVQRVATSDHLGTDFCVLPQTIHCTPIGAEVTWRFLLTAARELVIDACFIHFSGALPGSAGGFINCLVTDQTGKVHAFGGATVALAAGPGAEGCTGLATVADPTTGVGVGDIVSSTTCAVLLKFSGTGADPQELDDVKIIVRSSRAL